MRSACLTIWLSDASCFHISDAAHPPYGCGPVCHSSILAEAGSVAQQQGEFSLHVLAVVPDACLSSGYASWLHISLNTLFLNHAADSFLSMANVEFGFVADQRQDPLPLHVLAQEFDIVKQAFYTEPHDQSSWLYLRWLLSNALTHWQRARGTPAEADARQVSLSAAACAKLAFRP